MTDQRPLDVVIAPEPFTPRVETMRLPALGQPVKNILAAAIAQDKLDPADLRRVRIYVDGEALPDATPTERLAAMRYVPEAGRLLNIAVEPLGGGGDGGDKALQTVLTIALVAVSLWVGGPAGPLAASAAWVRAAAAAAVQVGGQMALSAVFAKDTDKLAEGNAKSALQDAANRYRPRAPMPLCLGLRRWGFDLAAPPYTTLIGDDQYLNFAVAAHYGRCWVGALKLGETLLADYPAADYSVEYFLEPGVPRQSFIYPNRVIQENYQDLLDKGGAYEVHTTADNTERAEIDLGLPNGLRWQKESGKIVPQEVQGEIQYQPVGGGAWVAAPIGVYRNKNNVVLPAGNFYISGKTKDPIRRTIGFELPAKGQYNVRVRVWNPDVGEPIDEVTDKTYWTALRSIERQLPIVDETLAVIFLRIKSTDDLNGNLPVVTGECEPIVPIWSGGNWNTEARSSNSAALTRWLLTGPAAARALDPAEIHSSCESTYDLIEANPSWKGALLVTEEKSQQDVMVGLGKMGRFSTYWNGSKLCFVPDWVREAPRQVFTGRNAAGYRYRRTFPEPIHGVFVEFLSLDEGSVDDEMFVYADGYDATNATLIETIRIDFACSQARAFQEGRVYLAKRLLQVEMHEWTAGADAVGTTYGDRVLLRHPATLYGLVDGRVTFRRWQGALVAGFRLDEDVDMEVGKTYGIDIRRADAVIRGVPVVNVPGRSRDIMFAAPRAAELSPRKGDLVIFGETNLISEDLEIIEVEANADLTVMFRGVPYIGPEIAGAINNPIPLIISRVTPREKPPKPQINVPDRGSPDGVVLDCTVPGWVGTPIAGFTGHWRERTVDVVEGESETPWKPLPPAPIAAGIVRTGAITGAATPPGGQEVTIDVRVRTVLINGESSDYVTVSGIPIFAEVPRPIGLTAVGAVRASADGSSIGVIAVSAPAIEVGDVQVLEIEVRPVDAPIAFVTPPGGLLTARNPVGDLTGLTTGGDGYDLRARWLTKDNWPGEWVTIQDVVIPAGSNVASDSVNTGGTNSETVAGQAAQVPGLAITLMAAQATIAAHEATLNTAVTGLVAQTSGILASLNTPTTGVLARLTATESAVSSNNLASVARLNALEATVNTPTTGLTAVVAGQTTAIANLETGKADATRVALVEARASGTTGVITPNAGFDNYPTASSPAPGWEDVFGGFNSRYVRISDDLGGYAMQLFADTGENVVGLAYGAPGSARPSGWYVAEIDVKMIGGTNAAFGAFVDFVDHPTTESYGISATIQCAGADDDGVTGNVIGRRRRWSRLFQAPANAGVSKPRIYIGNYPAVFGGAVSENRNHFIYEAFVRKATPTEIEQRAARGGFASLSARYAASESAVTDLQNNKADATRVTLLEALASGAANLPSTFNAQGAEQFFAIMDATDGAGIPSAVAPLTVADLSTSAEGRTFLTTGAHQLYQRGVLPRRPNQKVLITALIRYIAIGGAGTDRPLLILRGLDSSYANVGGGSVVVQATASTVVSTFRTITMEVDTTSLPATVAHLRAGVYAGTDNTSTWQVLELRFEDVTTTASLSARATSLEVATADLQIGKASVSSVTQLEARVNRPNPNLLRNPSGKEVFEYWDLFTNFSTNFDLTWGNWFRHRFDNQGEHAAVMRSAPFASGYGSTYTLSGEGYQSGMGIAGYSDIGVYGYTDEAGTTGETRVSPSYNTLAVHNPNIGRYLLNTQTFSTPANIVSFRVWFQLLVTSPGGYSDWGVFNLKVELGSSATRFTDDAGAAALSAKVTEIREATATLEGRLEARALLNVTAGNQVAGMQLLAVSGSDVGYSTIDFWAAAVRISNGGSNPVAPFVVRDGVVRIQELLVDRVAVGVSIVVGARRLALAVQPFPVSCTDGVPIAYGYNIGLAPEIVFLRDGAIQTPGSAESYDFYVEASTGTGFTPRLKIKTAGTPTNQSHGPGGTASGPTTHHFVLAGTPSGNNVSVRVTGIIQSEYFNDQYNPGGPPQVDEGTSYSDGYVQIGVYAYAGSWSQVGSLDVYPGFRSAQYDPPGTYNDSFDTGLSSFAVGPSVTHVGVVILFESYAGSYISDLSLAYQTATASGTRSATPNGEMTTAMIYPRNGA